MSAPLFADVCRGFFAPKPNPNRLPFANSHVHNSDPRFAKISPRLSNTFPTAPVKPKSYRSRTDCEQGRCSMPDFSSNPGSIDQSLYLSPPVQTAQSLKLEQDKLLSMYTDGVQGGTIVRTTQPDFMYNSPMRDHVYSTSPSMSVGDKRRDARSPSFCDGYGCARLDVPDYGAAAGHARHVSARRRL